MGLLLHARADAVPEIGGTFIVADPFLTVQAVSRTAELRLRVREREAVGRRVTELLVPADDQALGAAGLADSITQAANGHHPGWSGLVRPAGATGWRLRARIAPCGPPRAALLVLSPLCGAPAARGLS